MKKDPIKKLTRKLRYNCQKFILTIPTEVIKEMKWQEKDEIIILNNEKKNRIELYNRRLLTEITRPYDFPIIELKKRLKRNISDEIFHFITGYKKEYNPNDEKADIRKMIKIVKIDIDNTKEFPNELNEIRVPKKVRFEYYQDYWESLIFSILAEKKNKYLQKYHEKNKQKEEREMSVNKRVEKKIIESEYNKKLEILKEKKIRIQQKRDSKS